MGSVSGGKTAMQGGADWIARDAETIAPHFQQRLAGCPLNPVAHGMERRIENGLVLSGGSPRAPAFSNFDVLSEAHAGIRVELMGHAAAKSLRALRGS